MASKILLVMFDESLQKLLASVLKDAHYDVTVANEQIDFMGRINQFNDYGLFFLDMELFLGTRANEWVSFLKELRTLKGLKVVILAKPGSYPPLQKKELKVDLHHLIDNVIFLPVDKYELLGDAKRYLRT